MTSRSRAASRPEAPAARPPGGGIARHPSVRLVVVARGQARLMADLRAPFRRETGVLVIENRRRDRALLPRPEAGRDRVAV